MKNQRIQLSSQVRYRAVGEEGVLVHLENGQVIVVNEVGLFIIGQLDVPRTRNELVRAISQEFEVTEKQAVSDIELYLAELAREQVLEQVT